MTNSDELLAGLPEIGRSKNVAIVRLLPGDSRPVPTTSGMESDLGRRTQNETSPKESADSSGLGIVHNHEGGLWSPEVSSHKFSAGLTFTSVAEEARVSSSGGGGLLVGPRKVDVSVVNLDEATGDEVNPGGVSQITGGFELDQSLDVAAEGQMSVRRVILDTQQPKNGAEFEQPMNGARRERAAVERQLTEDAVDTASKGARMSEAESRVKRELRLRGEKPVTHVT